MPVSVWRKRATPIIASVLMETAGQSENEIRVAITSPFPGME